MNHTLAIARRELSEKAFALIAPAASALLILSCPLWPYVRRSMWREIYVVGGGIVAVAFTIGLTAILGASIVGREITERRMSFYFTKPVSAPAIWFGKLIAAALLLAATFAIGMLPSFVAGRVALRSIWSTSTTNFLVPFAIALAVVFFVAHILSTIARARSAWAFADFAAVTVFGYAVWWIGQPLIRRGAMEMFFFSTKLLGWLLLAAVIVAGAWQLAMGRIDRLQSHRALSKSLWTGAGIALLIWAMVIAWTVSVKPADLKSFNVQASGGGDYVVIAGPTKNRRDYLGAFSINTRTGDYRRVSGGYPLMFTPDGSRALMFESIDQRYSFGDLSFRDASLRGPDEPTGLSIVARDFVALSGDAKRIAHGDSGTLAVYDVPTKTSLGSVRLPDANVSGVWFVTPDLVRVVLVTPRNPDRRVASGRTIEIYEYDVMKRSFAKTGEYLGAEKYPFFYATADGSRLILRGDDGAVIDSRTAAVVFKTDGRLVTAMQDGRVLGTAANALRVYTPAGAVEREIPLGVPTEGMRVARALSSDKALVLIKGAGAWSYFVVDVNNGQVIRRDPNLQPVFSDQKWGDLRRATLNPNQLFMDADGNLVRWNPLTNERNLVVRMKG